MEERAWQYQKDHEHRLTATSLSASGPTIVYYLQRADGLIKIGTTKGLAKRLTDLRREHGDLRILLTHRGDRTRETAMHHRFAELRVQGEWFQPGQALLSWILEVRQRRPNQKTVLPGTIPLEDLMALAASVTSEEAPEIAA